MPRLSICCIEGMLSQFNGKCYCCDVRTLLDGWLLESKIILEWVPVHTHDDFIVLPDWENQATGTMIQYLTHIILALS